MTSLIPNVKVPMDFGVEYLGSPSHGNLKFLLQDGELFANSAIMSFNSPVIKKMTIELFQTEITVQEFSKDAVQCFLEASYSGALKKISKLNFRDLNKMAHVFEVNWLIERCFEYFQELTETMEEDNFDDQLFLFDEAMFILNKLKKRRLIDIVIKKFTSTATCTQYFATNYLSDIASCPTKNLDVIMEMTAKQEHILVEALVNNLEKNKLCTIDKNIRYILEKLNYKTCPSTHDSMYQRLFKTLEEIESPSTEDFRLIMRALQQYNKALKEMKDSMSYAALPNLFQDFQQLKNINDIDELINFLIESPLIRNGYVFYDAVYSWLFDKRMNRNSPFVPITDTFVEIFSNHMSNSGWKPVTREYLEDKTFPFLGGFTKKIQNHSNLVSDNQFSRISSISEYMPEELFARNHDIKFKFKQEFITNCSKEGDCGFILRVTAASGKQDDSFNMQLVIDPSLYPDDIHFHRESLMLVDNIHLALDITDCRDKTHITRPVTCCSTPRRDGTNKYWCWGPHRFYKRGEGSPPPGNSMKWIDVYGSTAKIRPFVYYLG